MLAIGLAVALTPPTFASANAAVGLTNDSTNVPIA